MGFCKWTWLNTSLRLRTRAQAIEEAIEGLQAAYKQNIFPAMKVRWSAYPEHSGHLIFDGCFRCHNSAFTSDAGEAIPTKCDLCHLINNQGPPDRQDVAPAGKSLEFRHPVDMAKIGSGGGEMKPSVISFQTPPASRGFPF